MLRLIFHALGFGFPRDANASKELVKGFLTLVLGHVVPLKFSVTITQHQIRIMPTNVLDLHLILVGTTMPFHKLFAGRVLVQFSS